MADDVIAIVLAGGASRRLGRLVGAGGKAMIDLGGESLLGRVVRTLAGELPRVFVVAAAGQPLPPLVGPIEIVRDREPEQGPLAAIRDGLEQAVAGDRPPRFALVASCDLPGLSAGVVRLLVARARSSGAAWVVPVVAGHPQVLLSAVATDLHAALAAAVAAGVRSPRRFLESVVAADPGGVCWLAEAELAAVEPGLGSFADVDTPEDLARVDPGPRSPS